MSRSLILTPKMSMESLIDSVTLSDAITYAVNIKALEEDLGTITAAVWACASGNVTITTQTLVDGISSATLTFNETGNSLISLTLTAGSNREKIYLKFKTTDQQIESDDYGFSES